MASKDTHSRLAAFISLLPVDLITATTTPGADTDMQGFRAVEFIFTTSGIVAGDFTLFLQDKKTPGDTYVDVPQEFLLGTEAGTQLFSTGDTQMLGYVGHKRFVRAVVRTVGGSVNGNASVIVLLDSALRPPINPNPSPEI